MEMIPEKTDDSANTSYQTTTSPENNDTTKSKRGAMYKATPSFQEKQEQRRHKYLSQLKHKRSSQIDQRRRLDEVLNDVDIHSESDDGSEQKRVHKTRRKPKQFYGHRIMLSEWLFSIPSDVESHWCFKICPKGKRELVVANDCYTTVYDRDGLIQAQFESNLPGGSKRTGFGKFTILDCIFDFDSKKYFVLDIIAWNSYSYTQISCECRFFFLKSKLDDLNETESTRVKFVEIPSYRCEINNLEHSLNSPLLIIGEEKLTCDGILFYHVDGLYRAGLTPLVLWLKPYMISELFQMPVHENLLKYRPKSYKNFAIFAKQLQEKHKISKMEEEPIVESTVESIDDKIDDI